MALFIPTNFTPAPQHLSLEFRQGFYEVFLTGKPFAEFSAHLGAVTVATDNERVVPLRFWEPLPWIRPTAVDIKPVPTAMDHPAAMRGVDKLEGCSH